MLIPLPWAVAWHCSVSFHLISPLRISLSFYKFFVWITKVRQADKINGHFWSFLRCVRPIARPSVLLLIILPKLSGSKQPVAQRHQMVSSSLALLNYCFPMLYLSFLCCSRAGALVGDKVLQNGEIFCSFVRPFICSFVSPLVGPQTCLVYSFSVLTIRASQLSLRVSQPDSWA